MTLFYGPASPGPWTVSPAGHSGGLLRRRLVATSPARDVDEGSAYAHRHSRKSHPQADDSRSGGGHDAAAT
jgi:hypothetical protein